MFLSYLVFVLLLYPSERLLVDFSHDHSIQVSWPKGLESRWGYERENITGKGTGISLIS